MATHFHELFVKRIDALTANSVAVTLAIPPDLRDAFTFKPGQFLTLKAAIDGIQVRRSYSICSTSQQFERSQELTVGIKRVDGGVFSSWACAQLAVGDALESMPPDGRFGIRHPQVESSTDTVNRLCVAAGSGVTPMLSIIGSALAREKDARFTLLLGNQSTSTIMLSEALQDLKDSYPSRFSLIHILSRQHQEVALFNGRIDAEKLRALDAGLLPMQAMDEVFVCGPEAMIEAAQATLTELGVAPENIHSERFLSLAPANPAGTANTSSPDLIATNARGYWTNGQKHQENAEKSIQLTLTLDGKAHQLAIGPQDNVLDAALAAGLDLPYSCKGGVCCTCRAKVLEGSVHMEKNFTLEEWEIKKGFVLTCQARPTSNALAISFDER